MVKRKQPIEDQIIVLCNVTSPLLELFGTLDDVFTEDEALTLPKRMMSLGRCYRAWKKCRQELDPLYATRRTSDNSVRSAGKKKSATVHEDDRVVLRTRRRRTQR